MFAKENTVRIETDGVKILMELLKKRATENGLLLYCHNKLKFLSANTIIL